MPDLFASILLLIWAVACITAIIGAFGGYGQHEGLAFISIAIVVGLGLALAFTL